MGRQEKPVDPAAGPVAVFALALRQLRKEAGSPTYGTMARHATAYSAATFSRAAAGEQLPTLPVLHAYVAACGGDPVEWEHRWARVSDELASRAAESSDEPAPYLGLARFEPGDSDLYFGRDRLVHDLLALTDRHRVVAVFGSSGSGKSSLLRAGLVPRLRERSVPTAAVRLLTPGGRPLSRHREALRPADAPGDTWLIVDQFEELFTLCQDTGERNGFLAGLLAAREPGSRLHVVLGIRADFYPHCLTHTEFAQTIRRASLPVSPLTRDELRKAIIGPATARSLVVERALTATLIDEVHGRSAGLPFLSHALLETWRRRRGRTLTLEGYERAGAMRGVIAQSAEAAYARMDPAQAETTRQVMLRLITPGAEAPDTRRPTSRREIESTGDVRETRTVLDILARARLITLDGDTVDLAHEALITAWPRLHAWIEEDREKLRLHRWLTDAAEAWESVGRDPGVRISPVRLTQLDAHFTTPADRGRLTTLEADFIAAGRATHRRGNRVRWTARAVVPLLAMMTVIAARLAWGQNRATRQHPLAAPAPYTTAAAVCPPPTRSRRRTRGS
ncbi:hypothetical protein [Streptomyces sp. NBC_00057]|uniref:nSTAND1 domain-containing NTPase n=1 Tax=Streptomyces sp. NBC_00057 TaxID=2975634 RepID=UPI003249B36A